MSVRPLLPRIAVEMTDRSIPATKFILTAGHAPVDLLDNEQNRKLWCYVLFISTATRPERTERLKILHSAAVGSRTMKGSAAAPVGDKCTTTKSKKSAGANTTNVATYLRYQEGSAPQPLRKRSILQPASVERGQSKRGHRTRASGSS